MNAPAPGLRPPPSTVLAAVATWHLVAWVLVPLLAYRMLPLDALELLGWGQEWQWGYYKHPPLGPWLGEAFVRLCGGRIEALYLLAQLGLVVTGVYVWKTARLVLDPARAALATVLLEGSYFHTYLVPNFNMNSLQLPLWAGFSYHLVRALQGRTAHWHAAAVFAALCLLTKYSGALLVATGVALVLGTVEGRRALHRPWPWLAAGLALALLAPHLLWLREHHDLPLHYLRSFDASADGAPAAHLMEPLRFALAALLSLLLGIALFLLLRPGRAAAPRTREAAWLLALCLGPLLLAMGYGLASGSRLKTTWAFPFFNFAGVVLFALWPTVLDGARWRRFAWGLAGVMLLTLGAHLAYKLGSDRSKTSFDGRALAQAVAARWDAAFDAPLRIVVGDHVLSAIVSSYASTRPSMLVRGDHRLSPWVTPDRLASEGAAVICRAQEPCYPALATRAASRHPLHIDGQDFVLLLLPPR